MAGSTCPVLPDGLTVEGRLDLRDTPITSLPNGLTVKGLLDLRNTPITSLPEDLVVEGKIFMPDAA